jgi:hypothetical protein
MQISTITTAGLLAFSSSALAASSITSAPSMMPMPTASRPAVTMEWDIGTVSDFTVSTETSMSAAGSEKMNPSMTMSEMSMAPGKAMGGMSGMSMSGMQATGTGMGAMNFTGAGDGAMDGKAWGVMGLGACVVYLADLF